MSTALEAARAARKKMKAEGISPDVTVSFDGATETELLRTAASKSDLIEGTSMREYVRAVVLAQAKIDAAKPTVVRERKSVERLEAEAAALAARIAKAKGV